MNQQPRSFATLTRRPSAFLPVFMSTIALALIFVGPRLFGDLHSSDEGPTAHLWQILMAGQLPVIAFFLVRWLRRSRRPALEVLALQTFAILANLGVVYSLGLG